MNALANIDWQEGKPPHALEIDAFVLGHVRRGWRRGSSFVFIDCTHPQQNVACDIDLVTAWRTRESMVVIEQPESNYSQYGAPQGLGTFWESVAGSIFG